MSKIHDLNPRLPLTVVRGRLNLDCAHRAIEIDEQARTLTCKDCGEQLDPVAYLIEWANGLRRPCWTPEEIEFLKGKYEQLERSLADKKRERDRLQREIRKLKKEL